MNATSLISYRWYVKQALALLLSGAISPIRFILYVIAQFLGAIAACAVLLGMLPGPLQVECERSNGMGVAQALFFGELLLSSKHTFYDSSCDSLQCILLTLNAALSIYHS